MHFSPIWSLYEPKEVPVKKLKLNHYQKSRLQQNQCQKLPSKISTKFLHLQLVVMTEVVNFGVP